MTTQSECDYVYNRGRDEARPCDSHGPFFVISNDLDFYSVVCRKHINTVIPSKKPVFVFPEESIKGKANAPKDSRPYRKSSSSEASD